MIHLNKNSIALIAVAIITIGFFVAGLTETLNYFIIKVILLVGFIALIGIAIFYGVKNNQIKNRPDRGQDDLH